jgi:phage/plasmid-like protein (TIGR03299 family)
MSHALEIMENGQAAMAYVGETPWHGLGVRLPENVTPVEMMQAAGLDWEVEKQEMTLPSGIVVPGKKALVRATDNKVLDIVGTDWNPVQNKEAFEFFDEFCEAGNMTMHTAGSLFDGKRVWALAKIASDFTVFGDDKVEGYLLFSNPHQFGKAIDVRFTPIRVVCNNTLTLSLAQNVENAAKLNHCREFDPAYAKELLGLATTTMDQYKEVAEYLGSVQVTEEKFQKFLGKIFGTKKDGDTLKRNGQLAFEAFETQPGAEFAKGSWWQALNAVTYVTDHQLGRKQENRIDHIWFGYGRKQKVNAVKLAVEMAEAG